MDAGMTDIATEPKPATATALIRLLYVARGLRGFGDGFAVIILPAYMTALGYDAGRRRDRRDGVAARNGAADADHRLDRAAP